MRSRATEALRWLLVLMWMGIIFSASSDQMSLQHTSRLIGPLVQWLFPGLSADAVGAVVFGVRKCAHLAEYAVLALLIWAALRPPPAEPPFWKSRRAWLALGMAALYAASDEIHQAFIPSRQGSPWDVMLDSLGAAFGLLFVWIIGVWRRRWESR